MEKIFITVVILYALLSEFISLGKSREKAKKEHNRSG